MDPYEDLAIAAENGRLHPIPGTAKTGPAAADAGAAALRHATGADSLTAAVQLAMGRPTLSRQSRGPSPAWRVRATPELHEAVQHLAEERGQSVSTIIREAVAAYVRAS